MNVTKTVLARRRRGVTALLAMLYLVLISSLAIGFYAATTISSEVSDTEERVGRAYLAADSGMDFMRRQLAKVSIPSGTAANQIVTELFKDLQTSLNGSGNLGTNDISLSGNTIYIPGNQSTPIKLDSDNNARFTATITDWLGEIVVKVQGMYGSTSVTRAISMDYTRKSHTTTLFNYAVASKGRINVQKGALTAIAGVDPKIATMMSALDTSPSIAVSGGTVGGDLTIMSDAGVSITGGTVGGASVPSVILSQHVNLVDDAPEFPTLDPTAYKQYAKNNWVNGQKVQQNIIVKAGTNPKFNANDTVQGIMYIESPNQVTFQGNFKLQGFIVMESGASTTDSLSFSGNLTMSPVPNGSQFDALRATSGVAIMAPNAAVSMTGSSGGYVRGNIFAKSYNFAGATDLTIDQGTIITYSTASNSVVINGSKSVQFSATGANNQPTLGTTYSSYYSPNPGSYQEVMP
jgi:hypothetical protein